MSGLAAIGRELSRLNAKGGKLYCIEEWAPYDCAEWGATQVHDGSWVATICEPGHYGAPVAITERLWWMDDFSDFAATLSHYFP